MADDIERLYAAAERGKPVDMEAVARWFREFFRRAADALAKTGGGD